MCVSVHIRVITLNYPRNTFTIILRYFRRMLPNKRTHKVSSHKSLSICVCISCIYETVRHKYSLILEFYTLFTSYTHQKLFMWKHRAKICIMMIILIILARACMVFTESVSYFMIQTIYKGKCIEKIYIYFKEHIETLWTVKFFLFFGWIHNNNRFQHNTHFFIFKMQGNFIHHKFHFSFFSVFNMNSLLFLAYCVYVKSFIFREREWDSFVCAKNIFV